MTTKHTPTPWVIEGEDREGGIPFLQIIRDVPTGEDFKPIAKIDCSYDEKKDHWFLGDEDHGNAAFIVKACNNFDAMKRELLAAQNFYVEMRALFEVYRLQETVHQVSLDMNLRSIKGTLAAIAKEEGTA